MSNILEDIINTHIDAYIAKVAKTFNIPSKSLKNIWYNRQGPVIITKFKNLDCYWHKETRMVFKSRRNPVVIGKVSLNGNNVIKLDKKDKKLCKKWNFQIGI